MYKMLVEDMYDGAYYLIWSDQVIVSYLQHQCRNIVVNKLTSDGNLPVSTLSVFVKVEMMKVRRE